MDKAIFELRYIQTQEEEKLTSKNVKEFLIPTENLEEFINTSKITNFDKLLEDFTENLWLQDLFEETYNPEICQKIIEQQFLPEDFGLSKNGIYIASFNLEQHLIKHPEFKTLDNYQRSIINFYNSFFENSDIDCKLIFTDSSNPQLLFLVNTKTSYCLILGKELNKNQSPAFVSFYKITRHSFLVYILGTGFGNENQRKFLLNKIKIIRKTILENSKNNR